MIIVKLLYTDNNNNDYNYYTCTCISIGMPSG